MTQNTTSDSSPGRDPVLVTGSTGTTGRRVTALLRERGHDVRASGAEWTILRPGWFAQNLSAGFLREDVIAGELRLADGDVPVAFVDAEDIGAWNR